MSTDCIPELAISSAFEVYLSPFLVDVLEYLDVASRFRLAATSRAMQSTVFGTGGDYLGVDNSAKSIWKTMDFSTCKAQDRDRLTDCRLRSILKRVHAKEVTVSICLIRCNALTGKSLAALHGSQVLEQLSLRSADLSVDNEFLLRILRPMVQKSLYSCNIASTSRDTVIQTCRSISACSRCGTCKYTCSLTRCHKCSNEICRSCSNPQTHVNKCSRCNMMICCMDCHLKSSKTRKLCKPCVANFKADVKARRAMGGGSLVGRGWRAMIDTVTALRSIDSK